MDITTNGPVVTPAGAVTVMVLIPIKGVSPGTVLEMTPLNSTFVALVKFTPVNVTVVLAPPESGLKFVT